MEITMHYAQWNNPQVFDFMKTREGRASYCVEPMANEQKPEEALFLTQEMLDQAVVDSRKTLEQAAQGHFLPFT